MEIMPTMFRVFKGNGSDGSVSVEPTPKAQSKSSKRSIMLGLLIVSLFAVASIYALSQFSTLEVGAKTSELKLDYVVGEKMTYEMDVGMEMLNAPISETIILEMEVQDFDGENYTINYTILAGTEEHSFMLEMNKTGHLVGDINLSEDLESAFSYLPLVPGFGSYLTGEEVKVGDSWEIPFDVPEVGLEGKISFVVTELGKVDVPAGTYDVLEISAETSGLNMETEGVQVSMEMDGVLALEKDTCRLVDLDLTLSLETTLEGETRNIDMDFEITLIEHIK
jgi:hypothetical protein